MTSWARGKQRWIGSSVESEQRSSGALEHVKVGRTQKEGSKEELAPLEKKTEQALHQSPWPGSAN